MGIYKMHKNKLSFGVLHACIMHNLKSINKMLVRISMIYHKYA